MLNDRKITDWTQPVSSLDDRPQMTASALKAAFDSNTNQLKPAVNGMIDDLTGTTGAGNIGVEAIAGVTGTTVQAMLAALKALIDLCDTEDSVDDKLDLKADKTTTDKLIKTVSLDAETGVFTFTTDDGTQTTIDTMLEKIPVNCYLDGQEFVLVLDDGTEQRADLSDFLTPTEFTDSSTIDFSVSGSTVTATIKNGSITLAMLESTVISTIQGYVTAAQTAASNASTSETNAGTYRDQAQTAATNSASSASEAGAKATLSQSWAIGGTGTRTGEDTNNSKYFSQRASTYATSAQGYSNSAMEQADLAETYKNQANSAADRAEQAAEDAEAIAGGDFIPVSQKGAANGVASLDASGRLEESQKPDYTAGEVGALADPGGGTTGQILTKTASGAAWSDAPDTGVTTFNSRTGAVMPQTGDYTADMVGAVPMTRKVNGKALSADVTLSAADVGAIAEPDGGTTGQILTKAESGAEWADPPETGAPLQGLPTNHVEYIPVREGQSIAAGDVVNVGREIISGSEQTFGDLSVGSIVQINENGSPVDYLVVHQGKPSSLYDDSCDGTWLLRKDIAENRFWDVGNVNTYADSDINAYLNGDWLDRYDSDTLGKIKTVKIPYCVGNGSSTVNSGANGLSVKAFLLGAYEVGYSTDDGTTFPVDGAKLDYFIKGTGSSANSKRVANYDVIASFYFLRAPITNSNSQIWLIASTGTTAINGASGNSGTRPCIIMTSTSLIDDAPVYGPETVYKDVVAQDNVENVFRSSPMAGIKLRKMAGKPVVCWTRSDAIHAGATLMDNAGKFLSSFERSGSGSNGHPCDLLTTESEYGLLVLGNPSYRYGYLVSVNGNTIDNVNNINNTFPFTPEDNISIDGTTNLSFYNDSGLTARFTSITSTSFSAGSSFKLPGNTGANHISACRLPDEGGNKRVCICFSDTGDGNKGKAVIATIDSSNVVTFGDVVTFAEGGVAGYTSCAAIGDQIAVSYVYSGNWLQLLTANENVLTLGGDRTTYGTGTGSYGSISVLDNKFVIAFNSSSKGGAQALNIVGNQLIAADEFDFNSANTYYISSTPVSDNQIIVAYADAGNSNYGTTTILEVSGNQIAGSFIDNSQDAIALADGTGGQSIPVGFGGYCECPGVTEGQTIDSSGVSAVAVKNGWLHITPQYKNAVFGSFVYNHDAEPTKTVNLGFKPSIVLIYNEYNNTSEVAISGSPGDGNHIPMVLTRLYTSGNSYISDDGFVFYSSLNYSTNWNLYYVAFR